MTLHLNTPSVATTDTPPPPYWEHNEGEQAGVVEFVASGDLYHIEDASGEQRRLAEGWCSLGGIDWEDEDIPSAVFEGAVEAYAKKNPVILWDHKREFPMGKLLEWEVAEKGLFVRFQVLDDRHFDNPDSEILKKCNEVWALMRRGIVRGLSWDGRARKRYLWSAELGKYIKQPVEILMSEITVTPVQVHPGAKVTGVNTLSKALRICKALTLGPTDDETKKGEKKMDPKVKKVLDAQQAYLGSLKGIPDGAELPPEAVEIQEKITKAMRLNNGSEQPANPPPPDPKPVNDVQEAITKALDPLKQQVADLQQKLNQPAPLRRQVGRNNDPASSPKPGEGGVDLGEHVSKALKLGGDIRDGKLERGLGKPVRVSGEDLMGLYLVANDLQLNWPRHEPEITHGPGVYQLLGLTAPQQ